MSYFDDVIYSKHLNNFKGYQGNPPETEEQYISMDLWVDASIAPTWAEITYDIELEKIRSLRSKQYPSITDQLDMLWHAINSGTLDTSSEFYTRLKEIKDNNPYPGV